MRQVQLLCTVDEIGLMRTATLFCDIDRGAERNMQPLQQYWCIKHTWKKLGEDGLGLRFWIPALVRALFCARIIYIVMSQLKLNCLIFLMCLCADSSTVKWCTVFDICLHILYVVHTRIYTHTQTNTQMCKHIHTQAVTGDQGGAISVWHVSSGKLRYRFTNTHEGKQLTAMNFDHAKRRLLTGTSGKESSHASCSWCQWYRQAQLPICTRILHCLLHCDSLSPKQVAKHHKCHPPIVQLIIRALKTLLAQY